MRKYLSFSVLGCVAAAILLVAPAVAGVFQSINSPEEAIEVFEVDKGGAILFGKIVRREVVPVELPELGEVEATVLVVEVTREVANRPDRLLEGQSRFVRIAYLGGEEYRTSAQPSDEETQIGSEALFFARPNNFPEEFGNALWLDGLNSVFRVNRSLTGALVVIGKGSGMPVDRNTQLDSVLESHDLALTRELSGFRQQQPK